MKCGRWLLALAYLAASLLAQGVHVHDRGDDHGFLENRGDCDESRPHVADHEDAHPTEPPTVCPSCQVMGQASLPASADRPSPDRVVLAPAARSAASPLPGTPLRTRCRAPPLA